ncbi:MAG: ABC transporter permease protein [uncultured Solirubrobacteraceae bacterium]|uniref:ABC transporter permease protein n=2 Tax=Bacteria TaxID=2 RepID=A0A6J4SR27_9ACTN|nr:MAG: ABC transporter permease protein [uncultured Solirubrobacteraceae bacterium]
MGRRRTPGEIAYALVIGGLAALALVILVGPILVVLATSFTDSRSIRFPPTGFSLRWYELLLDGVRSRQIHRAAGNTVQVAALAAGLATLLGTAAALALSRAAGRGARAADAFFMSPLVLPGLAFGLAALMYFTLLGFRPSLEMVAAGHLIVVVPFVLRTVGASLSQLDPALLDASRSLGAGPFRTFRRITLPLIAPGIAAGAFLAFMGSVDNVPVSLFLSSARTDMLPIRMWGMMESTLDVRVAAVSGTLVIATLLLMLLMERLTGLTRRIRG